jgi:hypothetical protein
VSRVINKLETQLGLSLPLNFSRGQMFKYLTVGSNFVVEKQYGRDNIDSGLINFNYVHNYIAWSQYLQQARQDIFPKFGYAVSLQDRRAVTNIHGYQAIASASVYLPGMFQTHSIVLSGSAQQRDTANILFSNSFANARGYPDYYFSRMWKAGVNYHFPIICPDWGFGNLLYFLRVRGNIFYDFERVYSNNKQVSRDLRSAGGELYLDTKWWNEYPLTFGFRVSHLLDRPPGGVTQRNVFEVLVPIVIPQ